MILKLQPRVVGKRQSGIRSFSRYLRWNEGDSPQLNHPVTAGSGLGLWWLYSLNTAGACYSTVCCTDCAACCPRRSCSKECHREAGEPPGHAGTARRLLSGVGRGERCVKTRILRDSSRKGQGRPP